MTPKEKAIELIKSMYGNIFDGGQYEDAEGAWYRSKQCALIAVDELIKEQTMWQNGEPNPVLYWQEVKQEIEAL